MNVTEAEKVAAIDALMMLDVVDMNEFYILTHIGMRPFYVCPDGRLSSNVNDALIVLCACDPGAPEGFISVPVEET